MVRESLSLSLLAVFETFAPQDAATRFLTAPRWPGASVARET